MTQNPTVADERRDQSVSNVAPVAPATPSNGSPATDISTVSMESPTYVSQTRAERVESGGPVAPGSPAGSMVSTHTRTFAGDPAFRGVQTVWVLLGITELVIALRVLFRALSASDTGFVSFINGIGGALVAPFRGIANYTSGTTVIEVGSLIAMAVYVLAAYLVVKAVRVAAAPHRSRMS